MPDGSSNQAMYGPVRATARYPAQERRLYIDTAFRIDDGQSLHDGDAERAATALLRLNNLTATAVEASASHALTLTFDDGTVVLNVAGQAAEFTTHDIWWLSPPRPA